ncbi:RNA-binding S4 domain-containing protein [Colwellia sp. MB3u-70]|uniref:RNA-binding S4 domain-containing protein n=1 Tax=unclassified Colwellia TaxID=196834 RepID=UPI0015F59853|nr:MULTISPECIES: RNA-binding S4 domain-containing protein [unclassified Colwellia]MBA6292415.1 RNA-binding S4 domain-containing protein [Colwellia sp. MB3u-8]MBA6307134.1 RNA-binding S4 domain-containing protein [Colwellia sp. MB3u-70]
MSKHSIIDICVEPIELCNLLKIANMVDGGEAKTMISEGNVLVNNEVVVQKRKKIRRGDIIKCNGKIIEIAFNPSKKSAEFISTVVLANKNSKKKKRAKNKARIIASKTVTEPSIES